MSSLIKLHLHIFNNKKSINMSYLFSGCVSLKEINFENSKNKTVNNMEFMFYRCLNLEN